MRPTRRTLILGSGAMLLAQPAARAAAKEFFVFWGSYTSSDPRYGGTGKSQGIYVSRFDAATGSLTRRELAAKTSNPSYLAIHPNRRYLYAVNEEIDASGNTPGGASAFEIDHATGQLRPLNRVSSRGGMPCHLCVDSTGKVLAVANWATGSTATFPIRADGSLGEAAGFQQHTGERSGPRTGSTEQPHCHSVNVTPDNRYLVATDTGLNKVFVYRLDVGKAAIFPHQPAFLGLQHPANPRQLVFHSNGRFAYVANEGSPGCTLLRYDSRRGTFEEVSVTRTVPDDYSGRVSPAEVALHPGGRLVFVSNRGHDSIATLKLNPESGAHTLVDAFQPGGSGPRSFAVDPTGAFLIAMMQRSNVIVPLRIDQDSGRLRHAGEKVELPAPVCARFVPRGGIRLP